MRIKDVWKEYEFFTQTYSTISRQLAFAAAAICWIFKTSNDNHLPSIILVALFLILLFFIFDLAQYYFAALIHKKIALQWEKLAKKQVSKNEIKSTDDFDKKKDNKKLKPLIYLYHIKGSMLALAYLLIIFYYLGQIYCLR